MDELTSAGNVEGRLAARIYAYGLLHVAFGSADAAKLLEAVGSDDADLAFSLCCDGSAAGADAGADASDVTASKGIADAALGEAAADANRALSEGAGVCDTAANADDAASDRGFVTGADADSSVGADADAHARLDACWERCRRAAANARAEEVGQAYTDLFLVPGDAYVHPWESCHTDESAVLFKPSTASVKRFYEQHGYRLKTGEGNFPPDHIAAMMDVLAHLSREAYERYCAQDCAGAAQVLRDQRSFVEAHVLNWVEGFAQSVAKKDASDIYAHMARLLCAFASQDCRFADEFCAMMEVEV